MVDSLDPLKGIDLSRNLRYELRPEYAESFKDYYSYEKVAQRVYIETCQDNTFTGHFYWREKEKKEKRSRGTEHFEGAYDELTQQVFMKGTRLENNRGLVLGEYQAAVSDDGRKLTGTWAGGGTWEAKWVRKQKRN